MRRARQRDVGGKTQGGTGSTVKAAERHRPSLERTIVIYLYNGHGDGPVRFTGGPGCRGEAVRVRHPRDCAGPEDHNARRVGAPRASHRERDKCDGGQQLPTAAA